MATAAEKSTGTFQEGNKKESQPQKKPPGMENRGDFGQGPATNMTCPNCGSEARCRRRTFSEQAWTVLLLWNEIDPATVDQPICDDCYRELRDILIERNSEIEAAISEKSEEVAKIRLRLQQVAV